MAARKKTTKTSELTASADPTTPLDVVAFLKASAPVLAKLKEDLHARSEASVAVRRALEARHEAERKAERTGDSFAEWRAHFIDQVAAAWLLSCVFVRTLEDRGLLGHARLAGAGAQDSQTLFFELAPSLTERDYLLTVFRELSRFPTTAPLFDGRHNPVWMLAPSAEAAKALLQLFRAPSAEEPAFRFGQSSTRFLGDLYQDLDEGVRKRFALLQTPDFVEEYILDKTLEPAIERFGLAETTLIDPTCGSGHFLLGAFDRLYEHRRRSEPDESEREAVQKALAAVAGADINPYAVAIARLRLTLVALEKARYIKLTNAPALPIRLAVADSLLYNPQLSQQELGMVDGADAAFLTYSLEDPVAAREVLHRQYAAVVGNPPYITCKDAALRAGYAKRYASCSMNYALAVPFTERFFQLATNRGLVGMITANSFMKREFGKKLIEEVLPRQNLTRVENTSGAYIPGHGTPTVLLFGTAEPAQSGDVHVILANRSEPSIPDDPAHGLVWSSITSNGSETGFENEFITVARIDRSFLARHPWSLGGGGATELKELLEERAVARLKDAVEDIGFSLIIGEDEIFIRPAGAARFGNLPTIPLVIGEHIRNWSLQTPDCILRPFHATTLEPCADERLQRELWPWRTALESRVVSGSTTMKESGRRWFDVRRLSRDKHRTNMFITFAFVATHNHFVLDRGGKVFKQSAPIIKLPDGATEDDHLALLAYLNSSTACFWMKQVMMNKGGSGIGRGIQDEAWEARFEFDGTKLAMIPLPAHLRSLAPLGAEMVKLTNERDRESPAEYIRQETNRGEGVRDENCIRAAEEREAAVLNKMVGLQERIDFAVYSLFGLQGESMFTPPNSPPGDRWFEQDLARERPQTGWFERQKYQRPAPNLASPVAAMSPQVRLIEEPNYKRRWTLTDWQSGLIDESQTAFLSRFENSLKMRPHVQARGETLREVRGAGAFNPEDTGTTTASLTEEAVPFLAAHRFTDTGLEKQVEWQKTWDLQRRADAGENVGEIPVPPKYDQKDYRDAACWRLRGKLDVPKERFISYPGCESDDDSEPVYGWAGWDHLQHAQALAALYNDRKDREGWAKERLLPMLAGILELIPWIKQWHNEPNADYDGLRLGDYFEGFLEAQMREHGVTTNDLTSIRPQTKAAAKKAAADKKRKTPTEPEPEDA